jgi:hypothetical protein
VKNQGENTPVPNGRTGFVEFADEWDRNGQLLYEVAYDEFDEEKEDPWGVFTAGELEHEDQTREKVWRVEIHHEVSRAMATTGGASS